MKQETLEESLYKYVKDSSHELYELRKQCFLDGYKLGQERSYSEEDMKLAYEQGARLALISQSSLALHKGEFPTPDEWFEQFKKI
jgi:hypothetical protein